MAVGDGEEAWDVGNGFGRKKEKRMAVFHGYTEKIRPQVFLLSGKEAFLTHQKTYHRS